MASIHANTYDVIIIGGGISGLSAAKTLYDQNPAIKLLILEGRNRLGGRLKSITTESGKVVDLGGMWVGPKQTFICKLLEDLSVPIYKQYVEGVNIHDDGRSLHQYTGTIPSISLFSLLDTHRLLSRLDALAKSVTPGSPGTATHARNWDTISLFQYGRQYCWTNQAQRLFSAAVRMVLGFETEEVSLLYFLHYIAAAGGTRPLLDSDGGGQDSRMHGGTQRMISEICKGLKDTPIVLNSPVANIDYSNEFNHLVTVNCVDGTSFTTKKVIMCCPPSALAKINFNPSPSPWKQSMWKRSHAGCFTKIVVVYRTAFWRSDGYSGSAVSESPTLQYPLSGVFDYCDASGSNAALCCFVCGDIGIQFASLSLDEQQRIVIANLVRLFGESASENVLHFLVMDWLHDPDGTNLWGGGCPVDISVMGFYREHSSILRSPMKNGFGEDVIFFGGTETATAWVGYMDGAVEAGIRVAGEAANALNMSGNSPL
jgi:monoamine oxidase